MTEKSLDYLLSLLHPRPYEVFLLPSLSYKSTEIRDIIENYLGMAANPLPVYPASIVLLQSTLSFRHHTVPHTVFAELRQETVTDEDLQAIFTKMEHAIAAYEGFSQSKSLTEEEQLTYRYVLDYVLKSIEERMASLEPNDRLLTFWQKSALKKRVEQST